MVSKVKVDVLETVSGSGVITVNQPLSGSGASLTSLPAGNLTGALPAISGTNLTNLPAANLTGTLPAIDGSNLTGVSGGKVLQTIISDVHTARESTTSTTKAQVDTDWSATITPSATSSKVLIQCNFESNLGGTEKSYHMTIYRDSTDLDPSVGSSWPHGLWMEYSVTNGGQWLFHSFTWLDSPNTTSAVVYKPYWWVESGGSWLLGGTNNTTDNASRIYLWEIGA